MRAWIRTLGAMMLPRIFSSLAALGAIAFAIGTTQPALADVEIDFGNLSPTPGGCTHSGSDSGYVCSNSQSFSASGGTFTATGFSNAFVTGSALTLKPETGGLAPPTNSFDESGLGENSHGPSAPCDLNCEINGSASVALSSSIPLLDVVIGSVQSGEGFQLFTGPDINHLTAFGTPIFGGTSACDGSLGGATCLVTLPGVLAIGVENDASSVSAGNVLLTAVSVSPAPSIGQGLPVVLAIGGMLFGARLFGRGKKGPALRAA